MADLSQLSVEQLQAYRDLLVRKQNVPGSKSYDPGVPKAELPGDDIGPHGRTIPKEKFPGFTEEFEAYPDQAENVANLIDGAAQMTRTRDSHLHSKDASPKLGGASKMFRGATGVAAPVAAAALPFSVAAAPVATLTGLAGGFGGGWVGREGAKAFDANQDTQDFMEDAGSVLGGAVTGFASESPKIHSFVKAAASELPKRAARMGIGGYGTHALGVYGAHALGVPPSIIAATEAAIAMPGMYRAGMSAAKGKDWLGPGAKYLFGPRTKPPLPGPLRIAMQEARNREFAPAVVTGEMDVVPTQTEFPSGRKPGGEHNIPPQQRPALPGPLRIAMQEARNRERAPAVMGEIDVVPTQSELPSGRRVPSIEERISRANEPTTPKTPPIKTVDPTEVIAAQEQALKNVQAFIDTKNGLKPIPVPLENPAATATPRDAGMAAKMRERDAAAAALGGAESTTDPVPNTPESMYAAEQLRAMVAEDPASSAYPGRHGRSVTVDKVGTNRSNKIDNVAQYLNSIGATAEEVGAKTDAELDILANEHALPFGRKMGNPVPQTKYKPSEADTWKAMREQYRNMIQIEMDPAHDPGNMKNALKAVLNQEPQP